MRYKRRPSCSLMEIIYASFWGADHDGRLQDISDIYGYGICYSRILISQKFIVILLGITSFYR